MWHSASVELPGDTIPRLADAVKQQSREEHQWAAAMTRFTKRPLKYWTRVYKERRDEYLTPAQAVDVGAADEVF
jgi:ATP-dependent protease ClpP protease subunit